jgi:hypothetical protein
MQEVSFFIGQGALYLILTSALFISSALILQCLIHYPLKKRLDAIIFKPEYYSEQELEIFKGIPLGLVRSTGYICYLHIPRIFKKRMGKVPTETRVQVPELWLRLLTHICFTLWILGFLSITLPMLVYAVFMITGVIE